MLGVAKGQIAGDDQRADHMQPGDGRTRFVELPQMGVAGREEAVWQGKAWIVLNGQEQRCRRLVKPAIEEIGLSHRDQWGTHTLARAQAQRGLEVLDREIGLTGKYSEDTAQIPTAGEALG